MVDTPKEDNGEDKKDRGEDKPLEKLPKRRCQQGRSKPCHGKNSDTGTGDNSTPDNAEDENNPAQPSIEQAGREDGQVSPDKQAMDGDSEDDNYMPPPKTR